MILTTAFGKEEACDATTNSYNKKGGSAGFIQSSPQYKSIHSCRASLNSKYLNQQGGIQND
jgi:hypothetical protein